jgi:alpha-tubulin suppressor-like RCC1 family protein
MAKVAAGGVIFGIIQEDETVFVWKGSRVIKDERTTNTNVALADLRGAQQIACGFEHVVVLCSDGIVHTWMDDVYGQYCYYSSIDNSTFPCAVKQIACCSWATVLLFEDNSIQCYSNDPQLTVVPPISSSPVQEICCGTAHIVALLENRQLVAWGYNDEHQCDIPENLPSVKQVSCGCFYTVALLKNAEPSAIKAWGESRFGGYDATKVLKNKAIKSVSAGSLCLLFIVFEDGTVDYIRSTYPMSRGMREIPEDIIVNYIVSNVYNQLCVLNSGDVLLFGRVDEGACDVVLPRARRRDDDDASFLLK